MRCSLVVCKPRCCFTPVSANHSFLKTVSGLLKGYDLRIAQQPRAIRA